MIYQDDETGQFRFVLLDGHGEPQGLISRVHDTNHENAVFGGIQDHRTAADDDALTQRIDITSNDPVRLGRIVWALDHL